MATGIHNKITGQIGEHLVSAMLGTMGFYASPYSGNVPGFDVTAVNAETLESFPVQVKTSNGPTLVQSRVNKWAEHHIGKNNYQYIGKLLRLQYPDKIWIMVNLKNNDLKTARYFICQEKDIQKKLSLIMKIL